MFNENNTQNELNLDHSASNPKGDHDNEKGSVY